MSSAKDFVFGRFHCRRVMSGWGHSRRFVCQAVTSVYPNEQTFAVSDGISQRARTDISIRGQAPRLAICARISRRKGNVRYAGATSHINDRCGAVPLIGSTARRSMRRLRLAPSGL
jgi:hypothetical protein